MSTVSTKTSMASMRVEATVTMTERTSHASEDSRYREDRGGVGRSADSRHDSWLDRWDTPRVRHTSAMETAVTTRVEETK